MGNDTISQIEYYARAMKAPRIGEAAARQRERPAQHQRRVNHHPSHTPIVRCAGGKCALPLPFRGVQAINNS